MRKAGWIVLSVYGGAVAAPFLAVGAYYAVGGGRGGGILAIGTMMITAPLLLLGAVGGSLLAIRDLRLQPSTRTAGGYLTLGAGLAAVGGLVWTVVRLWLPA